jgi:hypothetical protein
VWSLVGRSCIPADAVCGAVATPPPGPSTSTSIVDVFTSLGGQLGTQIGGIVSAALVIGMAVFVMWKGWGLFKWFAGSGSGDYADRGGIDGDGSDCDCDSCKKTNWDG